MIFRSTVTIQFCSEIISVSYLKSNFIYSIEAVHEECPWLKDNSYLFRPKDKVSSHVVRNDLRMISQMIYEHTKSLIMKDEHTCFLRSKVKVTSQHEVTNVWTAPLVLWLTNETFQKRFCVCSLKAQIRYSF